MECVVGVYHNYVFDKDSGKFLSDNISFSASYEYATYNPCNYTWQSK